MLGSIRILNTKKIGQKSSYIPALSQIHDVRAFTATKAFRGGGGGGEFPWTRSF